MTPALWSGDLRRPRPSVATALLLVALLTAGSAATVSAHGANIEYRTHTSVEIVATYDNGDPMSGAQVAVYAPDDLETARMTGLCDDEGRFAFEPDADLPGTWDVQIRQAGHGDVVSIPVGDAIAGGSGTTTFTPLQIALMAACVIWGSAGTILYFKAEQAGVGEVG